MDFSRLCVRCAQAAEAQHSSCQRPRHCVLHPNSVIWPECGMRLLGPGVLLHGVWVTFYKGFGICCVIWPLLPLHRGTGSISSFQIAVNWLIDVGSMLDPGPLDPWGFSKDSHRFPVPGMVAARQLHQLLPPHCDGWLPKLRGVRAGPWQRCLSWGSLVAPTQPSAQHQG